jgi:hypothetical protein
MKFSYILHQLKWCLLHSFLQPNKILIISTIYPGYWHCTWHVSHFDIISIWCENYYLIFKHNMVNDLPRILCAKCNMLVWQEGQISACLSACIILAQNCHYIGPKLLTTSSPTLSYIWFSVIRKLGSDNSNQQQQPFGL